MLPLPLIVRVSPETIPEKILKSLPRASVVPSYALEPEIAKNFGVTLKVNFPQKGYSYQHHRIHR